MYSKQKCEPMKSSVIIVAVLLSGFALFAQPVLETTYSSSTNICQLENTGEVYYLMDVLNKQCLIYKMDHSLYKTIALPTLEGYYLENVQYVSENLFNDDNLIELVYSYSKYVPTTESYYFTYETKLINENGNILLTVPGAGFTSVIETTTSGKKFLVYIYNFSVIPYITSTQVYSLPETALKSESMSLTSFELGDAYPNPAGRFVNIPVHLPPGVPSGSLELYDLNGNMVSSYPVTGSTHNLVLPTQNLVPGTYIYNVKSGDLCSSSKKIVVQE